MDHGTQGSHLRPWGPLVRFFVLTYAVMWTCFFTVVAAGIRVGTPLGVLLIHLGAYSPSLVALGLTARDEGGSGVRALLGRILQWRVPARWYLFAVGYIPAIKLTAALVQRLATGAWPRLGSEAWYLIPEADTFGQSFLVYVLQVTALSVAMAWLYARTNGSLLLVMLLHSAVNNAKDIVPSALPGANSTFGLSASLVAWITVTLLWICAGYFLTTMRPRAERLE